MFLSGFRQSQEVDMRAVCLLVAIVLTSSPLLAQQGTPIRASIERAATTVAADKDAAAAVDGGGRSTLFWSGLAVGVAGVTTSALGLTVFKTDQTSTGNAPDGTYRACVAQRDSDPIYASNQCDALKGKNLKLLWGGVAIAGAGLSMMILGNDTSAQVTRGGVGIFHRVRF
jgi:hypothetical protein